MPGAAGAVEAVGVLGHQRSNPPRDGPLIGMPTFVAIKHVKQRLAMHGGR
jgi:hypothetical protein